LGSPDVSSSRRRICIGARCTRTSARGNCRCCWNASKSDSAPTRLLALCGDLNLLPGSPSHKFLRSGSVEFPRSLRRVERFLFDRDIAKAARPLRLLGLDVAIESDGERAIRLGQDKALGAQKACVLPIYARAMEEGRLLVSASKRLLQKQNSPASYYLDARRCERSLAALVRELSIEVLPERFFSRCVHCNGNVASLGPSDASTYVVKRAQQFHAPEGVDLYECSACGQVYWFSPDIDNASARAQQQVRRLVTLASQNSETVKCPADSVETEPNASAAFLRDGGGRLSHGRSLRSAYEDMETPSEESVRSGCIVTNSKYGFHGCIDYVWLTPELQTGCRQRLRVPLAKALRDDANGVVKPMPSFVSSAWPSDHWPLAVDLDLPS